MSEDQCDFRAEERSNSDQLVASLEERAKAYPLFQERSASNIEAVALFLQAGKHICSFLRGIRLSVHGF